ncbi:MAG: tRNA (adenosine(37)-N6)-dimethylallyltransferase MiaA [Chitinophagales bacterium]
MPYLIVINGPTAVGKTALSIRLAKTFKTVILSCDSRQFFREMNIGTAKPDAEELAAIPHHFINNLSIFDTYTVGDYEKEALVLLEKLFQKHDVVIMAGGSSLYVKAVCEGLDPFPNVDPVIRASLKQTYTLKGIGFLQNQIQQLDPVYYANVDQHNPQRLLRALEVCLSSGVPYSSFRTNTKKKRPFKIVQIALEMERPILYDRINYRVDLMIQNGLLEEAQNLYTHKTLNALKTVGYKEFFDHWDGNHTMEEAIELIKRNTRRYAKRQLTWLRKIADIQWFNPKEEAAIEAYIQQQIAQL